MVSAFGIFSLMAIMGGKKLVFSARQTEPNLLSITLTRSNSVGISWIHSEGNLSSNFSREPVTDNHVLFAILIGKKKKDEPKLHNKVLTRTVIVSIIIERFHNQNNIQE